MLTRWIHAYYLRSDHVIPVPLAEHDNHTSCHGSYPKGYAILSEMDKMG